MRLVFSADIGQVNDYSALVTLARVRRNHRHQWMYDIIHLERHRQRMLIAGRPTLDTNRARELQFYPGLGKRISALFRQPPIFNEFCDSNDPVPLLIDATGVGKGVSDIVETELGDMVDRYDPFIYPIVWTGGHAISTSLGCLHVPAALMMSTFQKVFAQGRIGIPKLWQCTATEPCAPCIYGPRDPLSGLGLECRSKVEISAALGLELKNLQRRQNRDTGHVSHDTKRESEHDDIAKALAQAVWILEPADPRTGGHWIEMQKGVSSRVRYDRPGYVMEPGAVVRQDPVAPTFTSSILDAFGWGKRRGE